MRSLLRRTLLGASRSGLVRKAVETAPVTSGVVKRYVAGTSTEDALRTTRELAAERLQVTLDHLGEDTRDIAQAEAMTDECVRVLERIAESGLASAAEVSVKLTALGQLLDEGEKTATVNARRVCAAARDAGTSVTLDMEEHTLVDATLRTVRELRADYPETGTVIQAYLRRSEEYCAEFAYDGSRIRLCKGAYSAPDDIAFVHKAEIDRSYVRCMKVLMAGRGYPMLATHDPRMIDIGGALALRNDRAPAGFEYQMLYGIRPGEQRRLVDQGAQVRVYVPYGQEWYGYLMRRLAERPANLQFFLRSLVSHG